jgi:hypothetical protein
METQESILVDRGHTMRERVIFLLTRKELDAVDHLAKEKYFGNRSILIREALIDFGVIKKRKAFAASPTSAGEPVNHILSVAFGLLRSERCRDEHQQSARTVARPTWL